MRAAASYTPDPHVPFPGVDTPWPGTCFAGHRCAPRLSALDRQGPCLECAGKRKLTDAEARAIVTGYGFTADPDAAYPGSAAPWPGTCPAGHRITPSLKAIVDAAQDVQEGQDRRVVPCFSCAGQPRRDDTQARQLASAHYRPDPAVTFPGMTQPWPGTCFAGHPTAPALGNLQAGHGPCRQCAGNAKLTDAEARDLATRWFVPDPDVPYPGMNQPWSGTDPAGHRVAPRLNALANLGQGPCKTCVGKARRSDTQARLDVAPWYTPDPDVPYPGALAAWPGTCPAGHRIAPRLNSLLSGGSGCAGCAVRGFNPTKPGWLYLRQDLPSGRQKIGITNRAETPASAPAGGAAPDPDIRVSRTTRAHELRARGGVVDLVDAWHYPTGQDAYHAEQAILAALDAARIPRGRAAWASTTFDGYTETWPVAAFGRPATSLADLCQRLEIAQDGQLSTVPAETP